MVADQWLGVGLRRPAGFAEIRHNMALYIRVEGRLYDLRPMRPIPLRQALTANSPKLSGTIRSAVERRIVRQLSHLWKVSK